MILHEQIDRISAVVSFSPCTYCGKRVKFDSGVRVDRVFISLISAYGEDVTLTCKAFIFRDRDGLPAEQLAEAPLETTMESYVYSATFNKELEAGYYWFMIKNDGDYPVGWFMTRGSAEIVRGSAGRWLKEDYSIYLKVEGEEIAVPMPVIPKWLPIAILLIGLGIGFIYIKRIRKS